jgi:diaminobutyrate-2-oxoglutarate transaminase
MTLQTEAVLAAPSVTTTIPGPQSRLFLERQERRESAARTYPRNLPIAIRRGRGSFVEDMDGNVFLDFLAGAGVLSLGHNHPDIVRAIEAQLGELVHGLDFPTSAKDEFSELQLGMLPGDLGSRFKIHFCGPTGANAVEAAMKLCKIATGRGDIIAFSGGFHGSTAGAMAATGNLSPKEPVRNGMPGVHFFPFSNCLRCPLGLRPDTCNTNCATYLESVLNDPSGGIPKPAAVLVEPIQGEGGTIPATLEFVRRLREMTRRLDIPLIVDEVQTGCGRTGSWFAFEQYGIEPDVIVASKALSGAGLPVSLLLYRRELDRWSPGAHIGTFRGNQLAFAAGAAAIQVMIRDDVLGNVRARGAQLSARLAELADRSACVVETRGRGLMWGIDLADCSDLTPATTLARAVQAAALQRGLVVELGGRADGVIRLLPPLTVTAREVDLAVDILEAALIEATTYQNGAGRI